jgi:hypothetical protein
VLLAAAEGGVGFLVAGGHNSDSLLMALGFIGALLVYGTGFVLTGNSTGPHGPTEPTEPTRARAGRRRS